jgi:hypothetical protein
MKIDPKEVKTIKNIGNLHGEEVKMVATKGGLYLALGRKLKGKKGHEALAAGSHPALVLHQIEKEYKSEFQPSITKSEHDQLPTVTELQCTIKGLSMFTLKEGTKVDVVIAKFGIEVCKCECEVDGSDFKINRVDYRKGFDEEMKDILRNELNRGVVFSAKNEGIEKFIK